MRGRCLSCGEAIFDYLGPPAQQLGSDAINDYIKRAAGDGFSAKDFRTWNATAFAAGLHRSPSAPHAAVSAARVLAQMRPGG